MCPERRWSTTTGRFEGTVTLDRLRAASDDQSHALATLVDRRHPPSPGPPASTSHSTPSPALPNTGPGARRRPDGRRDDRHLRSGPGVPGRLVASLRQVDDAAAGSHEIEIAAGSPLVGCPLRSAGLPEGVVVTSIQRNRDLVAPVGDTVLRAGDRLGVVGRPRRPMSSERWRTWTSRSVLRHIDGEDHYCDPKTVLRSGVRGRNRNVDWPHTSAVTCPLVIAAGDQVTSYRVG